MSWHDAKLEEELTCRFKIGMKTLMNFDPSTRNPQNLHFNGLRLTKAYVWVKKLQRSYVWWHWRLMQDLKENWLLLSKMTSGIWEILTRALENLKNLYFHGLFLIKVYNVWAKKVQRSYIWWHWRLMQNLKENWFVLSKITWTICQIFIHRLKNSNFSFRK